MSDASDRRSRGLLYILGATAVAGVAGYAIQFIAPALLDDASDYLTFSVFWSTMYLFVGAIAGVQQEVTRATRPVEASVGTTLRTFTAWSAAVLIVVSVAVGLLLAPVALPADPLGMSIWFGVGVVGYLAVAVLAGVMYGLSLWRAIAGLTAADAVIRAVLVAVGLALDLPPTVLAAFIAVPFGVAFALIWLTVRRRVVGRFALDVDAARLSLNALSTVAAAAATGVVVTGLPLLIRLFAPGESEVVLASLVVVITITRAPLIVPLMALQSFLIVDFKAAGVAVWPRLVKYLLVAVGVTALAAAAAYLCGPFVIDLVSGGRYAVEPLLVAGIVGSAGLVALLCLTGPALLSEGRHLPYVLGWAVAAIVTVALLLAPIDVVDRTLLALLIAPAAGLVVHLATIRPRTADVAD